MPMWGKRKGVEEAQKSVFLKDKPQVILMRMPIPATLIQHSAGGLARTIKQEKEIRGIQRSSKKQNCK